MQIAIDPSLDTAATGKPHAISVHPQDYLDAVMILKATACVSSILDHNGDVLASYARSQPDPREIVVDPAQRPNTWRCSDGTAGVIRAVKPLVVLA